MQRTTLVPTLLLVSIALHALAPRLAADGPEVAAAGPIAGRWILDQDGRSVPPDDFRRGLQTSGLLWWKDQLWSVGDQRSQYPGHLFRIDPKTARLAGSPIRIEPPRDTSDALLVDYASIRNPDLEGVTRHPLEADTLLGVIEDKRQWLIRVRVRPPSAAGGEWSARLESITALDLGDAKPYRDDPNYRLEGIAASASRRELYIAYERLDTGLPVLYTLELGAGTFGEKLTPSRLPVDFAAVPLRASKGRAQLNLNGLDTLEVDGRTLLLAVARDQERLLVIDVEAKSMTRIVDVDFRAPGGDAILWVSPEGLAVDGGKAWIVNDPDSIRGNYRLGADEKATGNFATYTPLLFEVDLEAVLGRKAAR